MVIEQLSLNATALLQALWNTLFLFLICALSLQEITRFYPQGFIERIARQRFKTFIYPRRQTLFIGDNNRVLGVLQRKAQLGSLMFDIQQLILIERSLAIVIPLSPEEVTTKGQ